MKTVVAALFVLTAGPLWAGDISVEDAYARASRPGAPTGAMFMTIVNTGQTADRLIGAASPVAQMVELHTHIEDGGVMRMRPVDGGIEIAAGGTHMLKRGGDHVMLMGLMTETLENGDVVPLILSFEVAGDIELEVVVDNDRQQGMAHGN